MAFPNDVVHNYSIMNSDHILLILHLFGNEQMTRKAFKFEVFWTREVWCFGVVAEAWARSVMIIPLLVYSKKYE